MTKPKKRTQKKPRSMETLRALFVCKGGPMRDRRLRRAKEKKLAWKSEDTS